MAARTINRLQTAIVLLVLILSFAGEGPSPGYAQTSNGKIAFVRNAALWVVNPDGTGESMIHQGYESQGAPDWSPDGTKIAFGGKGLFIIDADGSEVTKLLNAEFAIGDPAWSPDGTRIAFWSAAQKNLPRTGGIGYEVHVVDVDGGNRRVLADDAWNDDVSWSADGSQIAFSGWPVGGDQDIYTVASDGSGRPRQLTTTPGWDGNADWSPDGSTIAIVRERERHRNPAIFLINADGTGLRELITKDPCDAAWAPGCPTRRMGPTWSSDGTQIAFWRDSDSTDGGSSIYIINRDGTNERRLTRTQDDLVMEVDIDPDWQPLPIEASPASPPPTLSSETPDPCVEPTPSPAGTASPYDSPAATPTADVTPEPSQPPSPSPLEISAASPNPSRWPDAGWTGYDDGVGPEVIIAKPVPFPSEPPTQFATEPATTADPAINCEEAGYSSFGQTAQAVGLIALGALAIGSILALPAAALWRRPR